MGGSGSGFPMWKDKKYTVEDCLSLDLNKLIQKKLIGPWNTSGNLVWTSTGTGEKKASCGFQVEVLHQDSILLTLNYTVTIREEKHEVKLPIQLETTRPNFGGKRWWFLCPLVKNNVPCKQRAGKLHKPPGGLYFGCRHCYSLTYTSCQESHQFDRLYGHMAMRMGCSIKEVKNYL